ncbi:MAG: HDIG domain-containing protein [Candidatus Dormibacteraeota bacterium]|nr:HDIG domain-containing protein [Candidatus Dormibacteraeota bacterium]
MIAEVLLVIAALLVVAGVAALGIAARRHPGFAARQVVSQDPVADAQHEAGTIVANARAAALRLRDASTDELNARRAAAESREAVFAERDRHLRERRLIFDERRFAFKKRREEIDARREAAAAERQDIATSVARIAALDHDDAVQTVLQRLDEELGAEHQERIDTSVAGRVGDDIDAAAATAITRAIERQDVSNVDSAPRMAPVPLERLDAHARERLVNALRVVADETGLELTVDDEKAQVTLRGSDPVGREIARQAALEVLDRRVQAAEVPPLLKRTSSTTRRRIRELGERALWQMQMTGRPELAELVGTLHFRFSYGQNALLHCEETGYLCATLASELGLSGDTAREAGMLHDVGKAVDHEVEGVHAIIGGELLRVLGADAAIVHAVKAHHFDEEPSTDLAMLTICADAISASRPGARRDTLAAYLARLEQLQTIATRHAGVERAFPLQAGREMRIFVKASQVKDNELQPLTIEIAHEIEAEMAYPGVIKVTTIRESTATATAPAQLVPVRDAASAIQSPAGDGAANGSAATEGAAEHDDGSAPDVSAPES